MTEDVKLKPCPFCGHKATSNWEWVADDEFWTVKCSYCCALVYSDQDEADAIRLWNRRVKE